MKEEWEGDEKKVLKTKSGVPIKMLGKTEEAELFKGRDRRKKENMQEEK